MKKYLAIVILIICITNLKAQDTKVLEAVLAIGTAPMYISTHLTLENIYGGEVNLYYNINNKIGSGLYYANILINTRFVDTSISNKGFIVKYNVNPKSKFIIASGLMLGQTSIENSIPVDFFGIKNDEAFVKAMSYNNDRFTIGGFLSVNYKLSNFLSLVLKLSHHDLTHAFSDDHMIYVEYSNKILAYDSQDSYAHIIEGSYRRLTYEPFLAHLGISFSLGRKKL